MIINMPDEVKYILQKLKDHNFEGFIVGGCVRDSLLNRDVSDWDITTNASPLCVIDIFKNEHLLLNGLKHGTVSLVINNKSYEITTYRVDGEYTDHRRPDNIRFASSLYEDLKRRDFTINAMAYNAETGIIDIFEGRIDLLKKCIRCVGDPEERFGEDALRIIRAIRFSAQLGFNIESNTYNAMVHKAHLIKNISKERIKWEIIKILTSRHPEKIGLVISCGLLKHIIPEINTDNFNSLCSIRLRNISKIENDLVLRLCILLHDAARTDTNVIYHGEKSSIFAEKILKQLKFENRLIKRVTLLIKYHDIDLTDDKISIRKWLNRIGKECFFDLIRFKKLLLEEDTSNISKNSILLKDIESKLNEILNSGECYRREQLSITGNDLIELGFHQGREIGGILDRLLKIVINNPHMNTREKLIEYLNKQK